jgi:hypothetical protein
MIMENGMRERIPLWIIMMMGSMKHFMNMKIIIIMVFTMQEMIRLQIIIKILYIVSHMSL